MMVYRWHWYVYMYMYTYILWYIYIYIWCSCIYIYIIIYIYVYISCAFYTWSCIYDILFTFAVQTPDLRPWPYGYPGWMAMPSPSMASMASMASAMYGAMAPAPHMASMASRGSQGQRSNIFTPPGLGMTLGGLGFHQNRWFRMENPKQKDRWFGATPILGNLHRGESWV